MEHPIDVEILGPELVRDTFCRMLAEARSLRVVAREGKVQLLLGVRWLPAPEHTRGNGCSSGLHGSVLLVRDPDRELAVAWGAGVRAFFGEEDSARVVLAAITAAAVDGWFISPALCRRDLGPLFSGMETSPPEPDHGLTPRQRLVLRLCEDGLSYKEIAREVGISVETVRTHLKRARRRS